MDGGKRGTIPLLRAAHFPSLPIPLQRDAGAGPWPLPRGAHGTGPHMVGQCQDSRTQGRQHLLHHSDCSKNCETNCNTWFGPRHKNSPRSPFLYKNPKGVINSILYDASCIEKNVVSSRGVFLSLYTKVCFLSQEQSKYPINALCVILAKPLSR